MLLLLISANTIISTFKTQEELLQESLKNKALAIFNLVVDLRHWNAEYNGVYVKTEDMKPNPYLKPNYILSDKNETLVWINPAFMTRQISDIASRRDGFKLKITSNKLINKHNAPDQDEEKILEYFEQNPDVPYYWNVKDDMFKFMGALKTEKACLQCHKKQGYKVGDVRGGISVMFDASKEFEKLSTIKNRQNSTILYLIITAIGMLVTFIIYLKFKRSDEIEISNLNTSLQLKVEELDNLNKNLNNKVKEEIEKQREKEKLLIEQSKLAALGEMIGNIAHQWRQPINTVSSIMMNIKWTGISKGMEKEFIDERIEEANEQLKYMSQTIDDFKNFFKPDRKREFFDLNKEIYKAYNILKASLEFNNISVIFETDTKKDVYGYANEFSQVVLNIMSNAKDVLITRNTSKPTIILRSYENEISSVCEIIDNGGGIADINVDKIFEPYFTTKEHSGTGIGLYISKEIIQKHMHGKLSFIMENEMTVFRIEIPLKEKDHE